MSARARSARCTVTGWIHADLIRAYLVAMGVAHAAIGTTWVLMPSRGRELGVDWVPGVAPPLVGIVWIVTGTLAAATAIGAPRRLAFTLLQAWPLILGGFFLVSWLLTFLPEHLFDGGSPAAITTTISYWALYASHAIVALIWVHLGELRSLVASLRALLAGEGDPRG